MQTLSVLTMAFLPATFLATVFAMPIMEWQQGMGVVMRPELGLFFGLAVPMTLGIFVVWTYLTRRRKRVEKKEEDESREALEKSLRRGRLDFRPVHAQAA
jgi:Mg2+ and Co2+ transporter CorA